MVTGYVRVRAEAPDGADDGVASLAAEYPVLGIQLEDLDSGGQLVTVYLNEALRDLAGDLVADLRDAGAADVRVDRVEDRDWLAQYRQHVLPFPIGRLWWIDPHPDRPTPAPDGRTRIAIEPRRAFGAGSHETTRLVLLELEELPLQGRSVIDVGSGSAILALAAETRGASSVVGVDLDPVAVMVARQTVARQEWSSRVRLVAGSLDAVSDVRFDIGLCNMLFEEMRPLLRPIRRRLRESGTLVVSGLLGAEATAAVRELSACGLEVVGDRCEGEWLALRTEAR